MFLIANDRIWYAYEACWLDEPHIYLIWLVFSEESPSDIILFRKKCQYWLALAGLGTDFVQTWCYDRHLNCTVWYQFEWPWFTFSHSCVRKQNLLCSFSYNFSINSNANWHAVATVFVCVFNSFLTMQMWKKHLPYDMFVCLFDSFLTMQMWKKHLPYDKQ